MMGLSRGGATQLVLDSGEEVRRINEDNFVIIATGERWCGSGEACQTGSWRARERGSGWMANCSIRQIVVFLPELEAERASDP